ncbi:MAG: hypothetical protein KDB21_08755 [Acidimicrobiales bacterium]|nr:hypothetical protein [Acidimicrobiales bacterium]
MWCFQCGAEYSEGVGECIECGVPTVSYPPTPPHEVGGPDDPQLAYDFHSWGFDARLALEHALHTYHVPHGWDGPSLIVREEDEELVDELIERHDPDADGGLDEADETAIVAFDLGARNDRLRDRLTEALTADGITYRIAPDGFLLVPRANEDAVADILEGIQALGETETGFGPGVEGVDPADVISELFVNADRLRKNPRDSRAVLDLLDAEDLATQLGLPFGMEPRFWRAVLDDGAALRDAIGRGDEDDVAEIATGLRDRLHPYV